MLALLLLLAIAGTAYLSVARSDRVASEQNLINTQTELQADGIAAAVTGILADDLNDAFGNLRGGAGSGQALANVSSYRGPYSAIKQYNIGDIVNDPSGTLIKDASGKSICAAFFVCQVNGTTNSAPPGPAWRQVSHVPGITGGGLSLWLADRIPVLNSQGNPSWQNISQSLPAGTIAESVLSLPFESPDGAAIPATSSPYVGLSGAMPGFESVAGNAALVPTLALNVGQPGQTTVIAADADGDGIADSLLFRIPGAYYGGLTWYAAVRIVDNSAAINVNTAWSRDSQFSIQDGSSQPNLWGLFPSSVGLAELMNGSDSLVALNDYRFNPPSGGMSASAFDESAPGTPLARTDYQFITQGDALAHNLSIRLRNPALSDAASGGRYRALPASDTATLSYHAGLLNSATSSPQSLVEALLPNSLYSEGGKVYRSAPYDGSAGNDVMQWWADNYNYGSGNSTLQIRPLIVTRNAISDCIQPVYDPNDPGEPINAAMLPYGIGNNQYNGGTSPYNHFRGAWNPAAAYLANDLVIGSDGFTYLFTGSGTANSATDPATRNGDNTLKNSGVWALQPWTIHPVKADANCATFAELFRAFWCVMAGNPADSSPFGAIFETDPYDAMGADSSSETGNPQHQFRTPLRNPLASQNTYLDPNNTIQLRAALAAVNAIALRSGFQDIVSRTVPLRATVGGATVQVAARVYSCAPQPFITEVYADNDTAQSPGEGFQPNPSGYVAIELYNPYAMPIDLTNWWIGVLPRDSGESSTYPSLQFSASAGPFTDPEGGDSTESIIIQPHQYVLLENYDNNSDAPANAGDANYRPSSSGIPTQGLYTGENNDSKDVYVPNLAAVIGHECVLLRPRRMDGTYTNLQPGEAGYSASNAYNEGTAAAPNLVDLVPVDSYDFTGLNPSGTTAWHYIRAKGESEEFESVYPGRYDATKTPRLFSPQTIVQTTTTGTPATQPAWGEDSAGSYSNPFPPMPIDEVTYSAANGIAAHWPNPATRPSGNAFPFGGFARNGDLLDIPFIGAYRIQIAGESSGKFLEMNALPMDCSFADDGDPADDAEESIGRFCPLSASPTPVANDWYGWARRLFDYLTVNAPADEMLPHADPGYLDPEYDSSGNSVNLYPHVYRPGTTTFAPTADATAHIGIDQDQVGLEGLINVNTASWKVLSMLPMVPSSVTGSSSDNESIAQAIVAFRNQHGPFTSLFDLNSVLMAGTANFRNADATLNPANPTSADGLLCPAPTSFPASDSATASEVSGEDYQGDFATLDRISNLLTTRSDTFTVYIVLEGWSGAGTPTPVLKSVCRSAFLADRSEINANPASRGVLTLSFSNP